MGKKLEKNRKRYDRGGKKSLHKSFRSGVRWPSSSYRSWNWVRPVFPGDLFPTKIATCASIVFFNPPPLPLFFSFLYFKGEAFPFSDVNSIFRASNSKIKKVVKDCYEVRRNPFALKIVKLRQKKKKRKKEKRWSLLNLTFVREKRIIFVTLPLHRVSHKTHLSFLSIFWCRYVDQIATHLTRKKKKKEKTF